MKTQTDQLARRIGDRLDALRFGEDFQFDLRWDVEPGPAGPVVVHQLLVTLPSPLAGQPRLLAPVRIVGEVTDKQLDQLAATVAGRLRSLARRQLTVPEGDGGVPAAAAG
jgi:hypothetical protein